MDFTRLFLLSALLCQASSSPISTARPLADGSTPAGEAVPVLPAADQWNASPSHHHHLESPSKPTAGATRGSLSHGSYHPQDPPIQAGAGDDAIMKPIVGRATPPDRPADVANLVALDALSVQLNQPAVAGCTIRAETTSWRCPIFNGVLTVYPSATLRTTSINCKGCEFIENEDGIRFCPNMPITSTKLESTASTFWTTVCARSSGRSLVSEPAAATATAASNAVRARMPAPEPAPIAVTAAPTPTVDLDRRQGVVVLLPGPAACPTTLVVQPEQSAGKTQTTYAKYTTTTLQVPCGGCPLLVTTGLVGYGPPGVFTKTTTLPMGTKTAFACL